MSDVRATQDRPQEAVDGITFIPVPKFGGVEGTFGARADAFLSRHFDRYSIPREWRDMASKLFFEGGTIPNFQPDVDRKAAALALRAWLCSFDPAHEAKEATVAYALWVWSTPKQCRADV